jgi:hypothetical protein
MTVRKPLVSDRDYTVAFEGPLGEPLEPGIHYAVIYATVADEPGAFAWAFDVDRGG